VDKGREWERLLYTDYNYAIVYNIYNECGAARRNGSDRPDNGRRLFWDTYK
jgi:hypothetical protein